MKEADLFGEASCRVRPRERGSGVSIVSGLPSGSDVPVAVVEAALAGLREASQSGPDGYPLEDIDATLLKVGFRDDAQPEVGVKVAASDAFGKAVAAAQPMKLEPVMSVEVAVPEDYLGAVIGDLKARRAQVSDVSQRGDARIIDARVPLRMMFGYSTDLRSLTKGRADFTMRFHSFDKL